MITYGLNCKDFNSGKEYGINVFSDGVLIDSLYSISDNFNDVNDIVMLCNDMNIEYCHFYDIIEDYLTDFCL